MELNYQLLKQIISVDSPTGYCNKVIDLLIKTGVFRGLKTVLHYMDVVSVPLCRKPFGPVDEKYLPELKALAQQLMQERG